LYKNINRITSFVMIVSYIACFSILLVPAMGEMSSTDYLIAVAVDIIFIVCVFVKGMYSEDKVAFKKILNTIIGVAVAANILLAILVQIDFATAGFFVIFTACPLSVSMIFIEDLIPGIENGIKILTWIVPYIFIGVAGNIGTRYNVKK